MRVAIHNPSGLAQRKNHDIYGYVFAFVRKYRPVIYLSKKKKPLRHCFRTLEQPTRESVKAELKSKGVDYPDDLIVDDVSELNEKADVLLSFTGEYFLNRPEKRFRGLKICHTNDFQDYGTQNHRALKRGGVQYVFGTGQLDTYSPFFRKFYPTYVGKVKSFPFGFAPRFRNRKPWSKRKNKAVSLGSVNPIRNQDRYACHEKLVTKDNKVVHEPITSPVEKLKFWLYYKILNAQQTRDFAQFHRPLFFIQPFRRLIVENERGVKDVCDSMLPKYPKVKDFSFDMVEAMNGYRMIHVDDGVIEIVGAKVYEALASGAVPVVPDEPFYDEFGFDDGKTVIRYKPMDLEDFRRKIKYYQGHPAKLKAIQRRGERHVRRFTHERIADTIHKLTEEAYEEWQQRS